MTKREIIELLSLEPTSSEVVTLREEADKLSRKRFFNKSLLLGQIGVETHACPGGCKFCNFSEDFFADENIAFDGKKIIEKAKNFVANGTINALFLMTMHDFKGDLLLDTVALLKKELPKSLQIVLNIGDSELSYWRELKSAGATGAYHVLRLREESDTKLKKSARLATIEAIKGADLDWYYCCEPIGSEHSNDELAEAIMLGNTFECYQHAAMARVNFAKSLLGCYAEISKERLAQIVACVALASRDNESLKSIAVHEPDLLSLNSGANSIYAECGANPRDVVLETSQNRAKSVADLQKMLLDANWSL